MVIVCRATLVPEASRTDTSTDPAFAVLGVVFHVAGYHGKGQTMLDRTQLRRLRDWADFVLSLMPVP